jgi:rRNA maturation endonuclease Nob1
MNRTKRYHLHCEGCGSVWQYDHPVPAPASCGRCGSTLLACTDMETGEDLSRAAGPVAGRAAGEVQG